MIFADAIRFSVQTLFKQKFKTLMLFFSISIGVTSVVLLTGVGEGGRMFVLGEFSMLGNQTLVMVPGKKETEGGLPPLTGESNQPIRISDAQQIMKLAGVEYVAPLVVGNVEISRKSDNTQTNKTNQPQLQNKNLNKIEVLTAGSTSEMLTIMGMNLASGENFHDKAWQVAMPQVLIGYELKQQLFANKSAIGQWLRLANRRYQIIGVVKASGTNLGLNFNRMAILPVHSAKALFNSDSLFRVFIKTKHVSVINNVKQQVLNLMKLRQGGIADVTIISQNAILSSFDDIMLSINLAVAGIGVISLIVAGILIMNVTLISVSQRTSEIGLLRAVGASKAQVRLLFLSEATITAVMGALIGISFSLAILAIARSQFPSIPFQAPFWAIISSVVIALSCALLFAWIPAKKASEIKIVSALSGQSDAS